MDKMQQQIQQTLIANVLKDKCKNCQDIVFQESWCTQNRVVRFTTPFFRELFSVVQSEKGNWKTGDFIMYEVKVTYDSWEAVCSYNDKDMPQKLIGKRNALLNSCNISTLIPGESITLRRWFSPSSADTEQLFEAFDALLSEDIPKFEESLGAYEKPGDFDSDELKEGEETSTRLTKYERNPLARKLCLEAHGTTCAVCGIDMGKVYGLDLDGKIEVHHIVPISSIGEEYVIDPVNDLVPVCPNCHTALHSKKGGGVYTVEELRKMMGKE